VSCGIEIRIFTGYDYVVHLHPGVFITDDTNTLAVLRENLDTDVVFFVTRSVPDDERFFTFDFFIFKPRRYREVGRHDGIRSLFD
jgi:hypothetical protein